MATQQNDKVTVIAVGDVGPIYEPVEPLVELALPVLREGDIRLAQCERVYSEEGVNEKRVPVLSSVLHPRFASVYTAAGFNVVCLSSNHTQDFRELGVLHNLETFKKLGITTYGTGKNIDEARKPAIVEKKGVKIAFLAYCSIMRFHDDPATKTKPGAVPMRVHTWYESVEEFQPATPPRIMSLPYEEDVAAMEKDVRKAKQQADVVIVSFHFGIHYIPKMMAMYQPKVTHAAIDAGADLILGGHSHNPKAIEVYKGKVCFYSLSNFTMSNPGPWSSKLDFYGVPRNLDYPHMPYGIDAAKTCMAKFVISKNGVERASFIPTLIDTKLRPEPLKAGDQRFDELVKYWEWVSDEFPHRFRVEGNEVVIEAP